MNTEPRYDVMEGTNVPMRVLQWATAEEVAAYCEQYRRVIVNDRAIGNVLREVTVQRRA